MMITGIRYWILNGCQVDTKTALHQIQYDFLSRYNETPAVGRSAGRYRNRQTVKSKSEILRILDRASL